MAIGVGGGGGAVLRNGGNLTAGCWVGVGAVVPGITSFWPIVRMASTPILLALAMSSMATPYWRAMAPKLSPLATTCTTGSAIVGVLVGGIGVADGASVKEAVGVGVLVGVKVVVGVGSGLGVSVSAKALARSSGKAKLCHGLVSQMATRKAIRATIPAVIPRTLVRRGTSELTCRLAPQIGQRSSALAIRAPQAGQSSVCLRTARSYPQVGHKAAPHGSRVPHSGQVGCLRSLYIIAQPLGSAREHSCMASQA